MITKKILLLGSTGSIGTRTLDVVRDFSESLSICGLSTFGRCDLLTRQVEEFHPVAINVSDPSKAAEGRSLADTYGIKLTLGEEGLAELIGICEPDIVVVATVGIAGLIPTLSAIEYGADVALANKEVLVTGGHLVMEAARKQGVRILPIDSEHNAVSRCMTGADSAKVLTTAGQDTFKVRRIILTASGGPFRHLSREELEHVTVDQALNHPTWRMGPKITIDSATLMNKGFEVIEGHHLFGIPTYKIDVLIHPQSIIHSLVEYVDGVLLAQLSIADMYLPIQNALLFPERLPNRLAPLNLASLSALTFEQPDMERFPCLAYAYESARMGGTATVALNAANEVAVRRFLNREIPFMRIPRIIRETLDRHEQLPSDNIEAIQEADRRAREVDEAI
ncbi:MAG: 1-deoxy-D-xylulose-5-phosphate reductoisomerase [Candidatus Sumerlaeota bacterium]|nr:1-deoxy-D-xylulose-5-phosphate reductoisomerase [Candidatus Sumerlaeota bacterium]